MRNGRRSVAVHNSNQDRGNRRSSASGVAWLSGTISFVNRLVRVQKVHKRQNFGKISRAAVDDIARCVIFVVPLDAGLHQSRVRRSVFSQFLGLQIELNFVPVCCVFALGDSGSEAKAGEIGNRVEFFDARKLRRNRWFFEIYIQGSKYNFLELSLNLK